MKEACAGIFTLMNTPSMIDIRHLWTTLTNVIFGDNKNKLTEYLSCDEDIANQSEHSAAMHNHTYYRTTVSQSQNYFVRRNCVDPGMVTADFLVILL